jgi:uncharacterized membrane protein YbhN (UPF0104 family)
MVVVGASVGFLGFELYYQAGALRGYFASSWVIASLILCGVAYSAGTLLICVAWLQLLWGWSGRTLPLQEGVTVYSLSNIMKYLPTNTLHLVGRYAALRQRQFSHQTILWSLLGEMAVIAVVAAALSLGLVYSLFATYVPKLVNQSAVVFAVGLLVVAALAAGVFFLRRQIEALAEPRRRLGTLAVSIITASLCYVGFFFMNAMLLWMLLCGQALETSSFLKLVGVVSTAWVVGYLTPGAPAGLGVREAVMVAGLQWVGFGEASLGAALAYRLVTLIGDGMLALAGLTLRQHRMASA